MTSVVDIGILIALTEEFREFHSQLTSSEPSRDETTGVTDYLFPWGNSNPYQCATTFVGSMGLENAALTTERFIQRRQPKTIVWLGIAGGIHQDVKLGDVVVVKSVNNYLSRGKAISGRDDNFRFEPGGDPYRCSDDLVRAVQDLEFAHHNLYKQWKENCQARLNNAIAQNQISELLLEKYIRNIPELTVGEIASGSVVGAAKEFISWLQNINRNYLAVEMEGAGMLAAVYSQTDLKKTLILRGISDFGDHRKQELDEIGKGEIRRYAMNNAINLLRELIEAQVFPRNSVPRQDNDIAQFYNYGDREKDRNPQ
jgi:nucleoside phosphorylase